MNYKKILSVIAVIFTVLAFTGCSSEENPENAEKEAANELEEKVVVYSTHTEAMLEMVAEEFENETGVKVEFINLKGELGDRVRAEKDNPQADIMFGGASSIFMELKEEGLYEPYKTSWADDIDPMFKDAENYWYGTIQTPVVMFYNADVISKENAPKDWSDLTKEEYKDQLVFRNALSSSARATYTALLQQYENEGKLDEGWTFMKDMDANVKQYFNSGSLMMQSLGRKEAGISFAPLNAVTDNKLKNNIPLEVIDAESGSPIITDGIGMIKNAKHPNAAKAFVEFAGGAKMQAMFANEFNRIPTNPEAFKTSPEWMTEIHVKAMPVNWAKLSTVQSEWMQKWDNEIKDVAKDNK